MSTPDPLVRALERSVRRLGVDERLALDELWRRSLSVDRAPRRASVASLLARDPEEWNRVAGIVDDWAGGGFDELGRLRGPSPTRRAWGGAKDARRWVNRHARPLIGVCALVAVGAVGPAAWRGWTQLNESAVPAIVAPKPTSAGGAGQVDHASVDRVLQLGEPAPTTKRTVTLGPSESNVTRVVVAFVAAIFLVGGFGLSLATLDAERRLRAERKQVERDADAARERVEAEHTARGLGVPHVYEVPVYPPVSERALSDSSSLFSRELLPEGRRELSIRLTLGATVASAGLFHPRWEPRTVPGRLVVLVQGARGAENPWYRRGLRLAERWEALGVPLECHGFLADPDPVEHGQTKALVSLAELARHTGGAPLCLIAPDLEPNEKEGGGLAAWVGQLRAWPRIAWIDPWPEPLHDTHRQRIDRILRELGVVRFPFTDDGVVAAARYLATGEARVPPDLVPTLPGKEWDEALDWWRLAAASVPDATWDQLECLRCGLPELSGWFPDPGCVAWLCDRVGRDHGGRYRSQDGTQLRLPEASLRESFRRAVGERAGRFRRGADELLLAQLRGADAESELTEAWRALRLATIRARLEPERAVELLEPVLAGPLRDEALLVLDRERTTTPGGYGAVPDATYLRLVKGDDGSVPLRVLGTSALDGEETPGWRRTARAARGAAWFGAVVAVASGCWWVLGAVPAGVRALGWGRTVEVEVPGGRVLRNVSVSQRPDMVYLSGGTFVMGSPSTEKGRQPDETQHTVSVSPFWMAQTEVTQAQYRAIMGVNPSTAEYQGQDLLGDDLPVQNVSWFDAVAYCNALSSAEHLTPAYRVDGESVTWTAGANGYRLPTEAEWEYAARSGGQTKYVGTDNEDEVCKHDNVADASAKPVLPWLETFACDDGVPALAPVTKFPANAFRLFAMGGNVAEWVWDWYGDYGGDGADPTGAGDGFGRVFRGGAWVRGPQFARVAFRLRGVPSVRFDNLGFRPARSVPSAL